MKRKQHQAKMRQVNNLIHKFF